MIDLIVDVIIECDDSVTTLGLTELNTDFTLSIEKSTEFLTRFYIRAQLIKKRQHENFTLLNLPIEIAIQHLE